MPISIGDPLPDVSFSKICNGALETISVEKLAKGKKLVIFGLPGAFTPACSAAHVPSFIRTADAFRAKGVDHIVCVSVNDPFVMAAWDDATGASKAGVEMLADGNAAFTKAAGLEFTVASTGLMDRCKRFSAFVEDGVVKVFNLETGKGTCELSGGEALLDQI